MQKLTVVSVPIGQLKPAAYNPRQHSAKALADLKESISRFGMASPLIANSAENRKNVLIGGHMRLKAAKELGFKEVPVIYLEIPDEKKEAELNLRLNRISGDWDFEKLRNFEIGDLLEYGFEDTDLSAMWNDVLEVESDNFDTEQALKEIKTPTTKPGDLFQLGNHRLICGNAQDINVVKRLVGDTKIDMVYSDPPYNIGLSYDRGIGGKGSYGGLQTDDKKSNTEYQEFLRVTMQNALAVSKPDCHFFYWCDSRYIGMIQSLYAELGLTSRRVCVWLKGEINPTPGIAFNKTAEFCPYATRGEPYITPNINNLSEVLNKEISSGARMLDEIVDSLEIWLCRRLPANQLEHPTSKPPQLHEKPLRRCTKPNDSVLESFGGSGSTLVSAEQLKRRAFLCELEPVFCDVIIRRYKELTGIKAVKL
jgi:DNA modification methylase